MQVLLKLNDDIKIQLALLNHRMYIKHERSVQLGRLSRNNHRVPPAMIWGQGQGRFLQCIVFNCRLM
jgi:hypothetical protein